MANGLAQRVSAKNKAVATTSDDRIEARIGSMEAEFKRALPRNGPDASQLVRDSLTLLRNNPKLAECEPMSFLGSLMTCAQLGLRPGIGALGEAWVLPMNSWNPRTRQKEMQATFIIGYPGMLMLANRSGEVAHIAGNTVRANDDFGADFATGVVHHPVTFTHDRGPIIGFYGVFTRKGEDRPGGAEFMSLSEMEEHRDKFAMAKNKQGQVVGPWRDDFEAMGRKTMIRQLFKWMPRTTEIQNALVADNSVRMDVAPDADLAHVVHQQDPAQAGELAGDVMEDSRGIPAAPEENVDPATGEVSDPAPAGQEWGN